MTTPTDPWAAVRLLRRNPAVADRFVYFYQRLRQAPRRWRRSLRRRLALTVAGAALLLALAPDLTGVRTPVRSYAAAAEITVANGAVYIDPKDRLCSLTEAIENAIDTVHGHIHGDCAPGDPAGADTIVLPPGGEFLLTHEQGHAYFNLLGLPMISSEVTIVGNGAVIRLHPATQADLNLLTVSPYGNLTVTNLGLAGGRSSGGNGGAIHARGPLTVRDSVFLNNSGAAIRADFTSLTVERSLFTGNTYFFGAGISTYHTDVNLHDSIISGSQGIAVFIDRGIVDINGMVFEDNYALGSGPFGGALVLRSTPSAAISHSRFTNNATGNPNVAGFKDASGGAISVEDNIWYIHPQVEISQSIVTGNSAGAGGGLYLSGGEVTVRETTISGNQAVYGGGILSRGGVLRLENSTISGNHAFQIAPAEGYAYGGEGGGLLAKELYRVAIANSTIAGNRADAMGGGLWVGRIWPDEFVAERALITGNAAPLGPQMVAYREETPLDGGFNLFGANGDPGVYGFELGSTDIVPAAGVSASQIIDPALTTVLGATPFHALPLGSPAVDAAPSAQCAGQTDQRGFPRNLNGDGQPSANECDIGAYERGPIVSRWAFLPFTGR